jgi:hypothetical protein
LMFRELNWRNLTIVKVGWWRQCYQTDSGKIN